MTYLFIADNGFIDHSFVNVHIRFDFSCDKTQLRNCKEIRYCPTSGNVTKYAKKRNSYSYVMFCLFYVQKFIHGMYIYYMLWHNNLPNKW